MIEHQAWQGSLYKTFGLEGQKILVVGWSHWGKEEEDVGTVECINHVLSKRWRLRFFTQIRNYFGYDEHELFWPRIAFFQLSAKPCWRC